MLSSSPGINARHILKMKLAAINNFIPIQFDMCLSLVENLLKLSNQSIKHITFQYLRLSISIVTSNASSGRDAIFKLTAGGQLPAIWNRIGHNPMIVRKWKTVLSYKFKLLLWCPPNLTIHILQNQTVARQNFENQSHHFYNNINMLPCQETRLLGALNSLSEGKRLFTIRTLEVYTEEQFERYK